MTAQTLTERRANVWSLMTEIMARPKDPTTGLMTAENAAAYDAAEVDLDNIEAEIARELAHTTRETGYSHVDRGGVVRPDGTSNPDAEATPGDAAYADAFNAFVRGGRANMSGDQHRVLQKGFQTIQNAAGVGTGSAGGYTVPAAFRNAIIEQVTFIAAMRQLAEVITTDTGATLPWPTVDDTANEGAILAENSQVTEQDVTFGTANLDAYMYTSKLVRVSFQLLNDSGFNLEAWLGRALGTRLGRIQNRHFTIGTGTGQPDGIVVSSTVGKQGTTGQTLTVIYDDLIDVIDSIDAAYLAGGNNNWMMNQTIRKVIRKLKDSQNRPLWEPSLQAGQPDTLLGYGIKLNNYVPVPAASAKSILFGDFREAYVIRDVSGIQLLRLEERYADFLQVGFLAFQRSDGTMQNASAVKAYQHSAT